ncbi:Re/Si-specific NAD(P)(+) transhydrogenase subunit alpha [Candidatus Enterovibrio escicola]|uniref:NAD(P) transhydrogenase subunit alpha n=1 Tax=Candidatus Enterovibrio escicola TaxID=1927127 RepID=A0A2A5SZE2_9GAMM|nr:Re/Si-specific NAD(P)(+) transhydrogenase subunit alpha [Candidatus Enterovibrio escacola]PCS21250.1 NAD(P) transhydrogenase alpha subunit [Candidatus Enterovibrio escacola]
MRIGIPKERVAHETRVAATPKTVEQLIQMGFDVVVEYNAGQLASFDNEAFEQAGATVGDTDLVWQSEIIIKVNAPIKCDESCVDELELIKEGTTLVSFIWPAQNETLMGKLSAKKINVLAMDAVPRISRAQALDALSSMANIAGYRAVVEAAHEFGRFFTGQITAAGKVPPAKVFVVGVGVAGLAAIGTAGSLGAIVRAFDVRPEVKEQVESMGGQFLQVAFEKQMGSGDCSTKEISDDFNRKVAELYAEQAKQVDIIITTALLEGRPAPKLITTEMVDAMQPGSVIVDLASANGGNCEYTVADKVVVTDNGVKIIGYTDMVGRMPTQSSQLYSCNVVNLMKLLCKEKDGNIHIDFADVVLRGLTVVRDGKVTWPAPPIQVSMQPQVEHQVESAVNPVKESISPMKRLVALVLGMGGFTWAASFAPVAFLSHVTVFVLACVVGYYVVWNVAHALHTPLMSVTNAISGIIVVGAILQITQGNVVVSFLAFIAILITSINIFGGFTVTKRMLEMFRKDK